MTSTKETKPFLVISETSTSTQHYHLRQIKPGDKIMLGGGSYLRALCRHNVGWDTQIPLSSWGSESHIPQTWCSKCAEIAWSEHRELLPTHPHIREQKE